MNTEPILVAPIHVMDKLSELRAVSYMVVF